MAAKVFWVGIALISVLTIAASISFAGWLILQAAKADGKIDYCYTKQDDGIMNKEYTVYGHRQWRDDQQIATFKSLPDAETWRTQKCPR